MSAPEMPRMPGQEPKRQSWSEYGKEKYRELYDKWVPWLEDLYLRWFTKDNKASYTTKENLDKAKVTGIEQIDTLQDGVHGLVAGQVGQGGLAQPIGDAFSREGLTRAERGGKDDKGSYVPGAVSAGAQGVADGGRQAAGKVGEGASAAGGFVGGLFGGGGQQKGKQQQK